MILTVEDERKPITEWAEDFGIPCSLIRSRLRRGWSEERAVTEPMIVRRGEKLPADAAVDQAPKPRVIVAAPVALRVAPPCASRPSMLRRQTKFGPEARRLDHNGLSLTVSEWAERLGMTTAAIYARLSKGASVEEALTPGDQRGPISKPIECNGEALTMAQWAERTGISPLTIRSRLRLGWPLERALTEPLRKDMPKAERSRRPRAERKARRINFDGLSLTCSEWAERTGIAYHTLKRRLQNGWSVERALTEPTHTKCGPAPRLIELNGDKLTVAEWSRRLGIHEDALRNRLIRPGWTLERALTTGSGQGKRHLELAA